MRRPGRKATEAAESAEARLGALEATVQATAHLEERMVTMEKQLEEQQQRIQQQQIELDGAGAGARTTDIAGQWQPSQLQRTSSSASTPSDRSLPVRSASLSSSGGDTVPTTDDTSFHVDDQQFFEFDLNNKPPAFLAGCSIWFAVVLYTSVTIKCLFGLWVILVVTMLHSYYKWHAHQKQRLGKASSNRGKSKGDGTRDPFLSARSKSNSRPNADKDCDFVYSNCWDELFSVENEDDMTAPGFTFWLILGPALLAMIWGGAEYVLWSAPGGSTIIGTNGSREFPCIDADPEYRLPCFLNHCTQFPFWIFTGGGILVLLTAGWERSLATTAHIQAKARFLDSMTKENPSSSGGQKCFVCSGYDVSEIKERPLVYQAQCKKKDCVPEKDDTRWLSAKLAEIWDVHFVREGHRKRGKEGPDPNFEEGKGCWGLCPSCPLWKCSGSSPDGRHDARQGWACKGKEGHEYPKYKQFSHANKPANPDLPASKLSEEQVSVQIEQLIPDEPCTGSPGSNERRLQKELDKLTEKTPAPGLCSLVEKYASVCALLCGCACALMCSRCGRGNRKKNDADSQTPKFASCFGRHGDHGSKRVEMVKALASWNLGFIVKVFIAILIGMIYLIDARFRGVLFPHTESANEHPVAHPLAAGAVFVAAVLHSAISIVFVMLVLDNLVLLFSENYQILVELGDAAQLNGDGPAKDVPVVGDSDVAKLCKVRQQLKYWWWLRNFAMNTKCTLNFKLGITGFVTILGGTLVLTTLVVAFSLQAEKGDLVKPAIFAAIIPAALCVSAAWKCLVLEVKSRRRSQLHAVDLERRVLNLSISMRDGDMDDDGNNERAKGLRMQYHNTPDGAGQTVFFTDTLKRRHLEDIHEISRQMMQLIENEQPRQIGGIFITGRLLTGVQGYMASAAAVVIGKFAR